MSNTQGATLTTDGAETPPNLSRVQVYLYGVLALFLGVVAVNLSREVGVSPADRSLIVWTALGVVLGVAVAAAAVVLVVRRARRLPTDTRYRLSRVHTLALTGAIVAFLGVVTVEPGLVSAGGGADGIGLPPTNLVAVVPLVAAVATVAVLGFVRRRTGGTSA